MTSARTTPANFWSNNVVLVQLLSLSPVLAVSQTAIKGFTIAVFTSVVALIAVLINRMLHSKIKPSLHFIWSLFLVGSITTILELLLQLTFMPLSRELGIYLALASCNLALLLHLEQQYQLGSEVSYQLLLSRSLLFAAGLILAIGVFASLREVIVFGSIFSDLDLLTSKVGMPNDTALNTRENQIFSFGLLQPGAFIVLALVIAGKRWLDQSILKPKNQPSEPVEKITRARVTGKL
jgi:Na+-translocating ferredoxin:NAD+ oxidoreductase RnfE subunit